MALPQAEVRIPPLNTGDRLTREEFERIWEMHPEIKKAELIGGMVFTEMTVSQRHSKPHGVLSTWLGLYAARNAGVEMLDNVTVRLGRDDLQPDLLLRRTEGGSSALDEDYCVAGPPELVVEVAASSRSYDLNIKKDAYERGGVREYLCWQVFEERIDWWRLERGRYVSITPTNGVLESHEFPGLRLPVDAMLHGEMSTVLAAIE